MEERKIQKAAIGAATAALPAAVTAGLMPCRLRVMFVIAPARIVRGWSIVFILLAGAFDARTAAQAQTYCAMYDDGSKSCGIPSLDSCRQSIDGVGGYCTPDQTSQMRPDLINPLRRMMPLPDTISPSPDNSPGNLEWMPPPPEQ